MITPDGNYDVFFAFVAVSWTIVFLSIVLLFIKAVSVLTVGVFFWDAKVQQQRDAARGTVASGVDLLGEWVSSLTMVITQGILYLITVILYFGLLIVLAVFLHVTYLHFPIMLGAMTAGWNDTVAQYWEDYVLKSLQYLEPVFENVVGVYNFGIFVLFKLPLTLLLHMAGGGLDDIVGFGRELGMAGTTLVQSVDAWSIASVRECSGIQFGVKDISCYDPTLRELDLYTSFVHINKAMVHVIDFIPRKCGVVASPIALLLYPTTDPDISKGLHFVLNAFQQIIQSFFIALLRWKDSKRVSMSVPDFGPCFDYLSYGLIHLGRGLDSWGDIAFYALTSIIDPSQVTPCDNLKGSWDFDLQRQLLKSFGENRTVMTSLTPTLFAVTDGYNVEYHHHGRKGGVRMSVGAWPIEVNVTYGIAAVSYARDVSREDTASGHTTALFGCSCVDDVVEGVKLLCAIAPYEMIEGVAQTAFVVDVAWEVANTPKRMLCRDTKIAVESVRFQAQRVTTPDDFDAIPFLEKPATCITQNTCTKIDAAVWVMPVCPIARPTAVTGIAVPIGGETACLRSLRDFSCFPFCLGVHRTFAANERMIIRSSNAWEDNVMLAGRDCVFEDVGKVSTQTSSKLMPEDDESVTATWVPGSTIDEIPRVKMAKPSSSDSVCVVNENMVSSVQVLNEERYNSTRVFRELYSFGKDKAYANDYAENLYRFSPTDAMLVEEQPLVFAGDYALRTMTYCEQTRAGAAVGWDGSQNLNGICHTVLDVMRITSNEHNEFQLRHVLPYGIPVTRRPTTIAQTASVLRPGMATLPPVVVRSVYLHNPGTSTRGAIWYGVNHDFEMLHCIARYCREFHDLVNCLSFSVLSNYESLRVWKITPGGGCTRNPETGKSVCPEHVVRTVVLNDTYSMPPLSAQGFDFYDFCREDRDMNLFIEDMEAFDHMNVAVAMRRGNVQGLYNQLWGNSGAASSTTPRSNTVYYFINVRTLEVRENEPWVDAPVLLDGAGFLCREMRIMPPLGSAVADIFNAGIFLVKMVTGVILGIPALVELYDDPDARCDLAKRSHHHSLFRECGTAYLDLTEMFDAVNRANTHIWSVLDTVSRVVGMSTDDDSAQLLQTFLSGSQMYQESRLVLSKTSFVASAVAVSPSNPVNVAARAVSGGLMSGMSVGVAPIAMAEYMHRVVTRMIDRVIVTWKREKLSLDNPFTLEGKTLSFKRLSQTRRTFLTITGNMTIVWYDSLRTDYNDLVSNRMRRSCSGLSLMMGYTNTYAQFIRHWCLAGVEFSTGVMSALGSLLVEVPLTVCVCVRSNQHSFMPFLRDVCAPETSPSLRNFVAAMMTWENDIYVSQDLDKQAVMQQVCSTTMHAFEDSLLNAFNRWAEEHTEAARHTISLLDYLGVLLGQASAECASIETNPLVSVMVPSPIDYFRVCGTTTICVTKCKAYSQALNREIAARSGIHRLDAISFHTTVESPMFQRLFGGVYEEPNLQLVTMSELHIESDVCVDCQGMASDCVGVVGTEFETVVGPPTTITVRAYCVPADIEKQVFMASEWKMDDTYGFPVSDLLDKETSDRLMRVAFSVPFGDHVIVLSETNNFAVGNDMFAGHFQHLHIWRSNRELRMDQLTNAANVADECTSQLLALVEPDEAMLVDSETGEQIPFNSKIEKVRILDFVSIVSSEYTVDMLLRLDVTVVLFFDEGFVPPTRKVVTMYVRVGWCEYLPSTFQVIPENPA